MSRRIVSRYEPLGGHRRPFIYNCLSASASHIESELSGNGSPGIANVIVLLSTASVAKGVRSFPAKAGLRDLDDITNYSQVSNQRCDI